MVEVQSGYLLRDHILIWGNKVVNILSVTHLTARLVPCLRKAAEGVANWIGALFFCASDGVCEDLITLIVE